MDWFTILLLVVFFVLPLIQRVLEQARRRNELPAEDDLGEEGAEWGLPIPTGEVKRSDEESAAKEVDGEGGWATDWGSWPVPPKEPVSLEDLAPRPDRRTASVRGEGVVLQKTPKEPAPERSSTPHRATGPASARQKRPTFLQSTVQRSTGRGSSASLMKLDRAGRGVLSRAIVLSEVLGPPRALRPDVREDH